MGAGHYYYSPPPPLPLLCGRADKNDLSHKKDKDIEKDSQRKKTLGTKIYTGYSVLVQDAFVSLLLLLLLLLNVSQTIRLSYPMCSTDSHVGLYGKRVFSRP